MSLDVGQTLQALVDSAAEWAAPAIMAGLLGWWAIRRKQLKAWREARKARKEAFDAMIAGWPEHCRTVACISKEVSPDGGGSLADAVRRTETSLRDMGDAVGEIRGVLRTQSDMSDDGEFQCTPAGINTFVNLPYARLLGVGTDDLLGNQWKNFIAPEEATAFLAANAAALAEHRPFNGRCYMVRSDGDRVLVDVTMYPDPKRPPAQRWFGKIREVG